MSVGKYNKKCMLPMQKADNINIAMQFLGRNGVDVNGITPRGIFWLIDIMNGDKTKILTLFNYILMKFS
jgi:hypothetical protein